MSLQTLNVYDDYYYCDWSGKQKINILKTKYSLWEYKVKRKGYHLCT